MTNKYDGHCVDCGCSVGAGHGQLKRSAGGAWIVSCGRRGQSKSTAAPKARRSRDWPGKECPRCGSEDLDRNLSCWECGYRGQA